MNNQNDQEQFYWNYDKLYCLYKEIDKLLDCAGYDEEEEKQMQHKVRDRIKELAISLGVCADFLYEYSQNCKENGLVFYE